MRLFNSIGSSSKSTDVRLVVSSPAVCLSMVVLLSARCDWDEGFMFSEVVSISSDGLSGIVLFCMVFDLEPRGLEPGLDVSNRVKDLET